MTFHSDPNVLIIELERDGHVTDYSEIVIREKTKKSKVIKVVKEFIEEVWERQSKDEEHFI